MAMQILDHVQLAVSDYGRARDFYVKALAPLGWTMMMEFPMGGDQMAGGLGTQGKPYIWLANTGRPSPTGHVAVGAKNAAEVNAFYEAALGAGGTDNGKPGIRADYHPKYYAAYVRDPDGNNIEAVWQGQAEEAVPVKAPARRASARKAAAKKPAARKPASAKKPAGRVAATKKPAAKPASRGSGKRKPTGGRGGARGRTGRK